MNTGVFAQSASITQGCVPLEVTFTPPSGSGTHFWTFGDGATSLLSNPTNTFINPGTYTVQYANSAGGPTVGTITINVYPKPVPTFTATPSAGCSPLPVQFTNTTTLSPGITITGFSWVYGDGGLGSGPNPSHTFSAVGSHFVSMGITTNLITCNVTEVYTDHITVDQSPLTVFTTTPNPATSCEPPLTVNFNNLSATGAGITYAWDFGNGNTSTAQSPPAQTYTTNGNFVISLQVTNAAGCTGQMQRTVSIGQPTTAFSVPSEVCLGSSIALTNQSTPGNYFWTYSAGITPFSAPTAQNPIIVFSAAGPQTITLQTTSANGQCTSQSTQTVMVQNPSAAFTSTPDLMCQLPTNVAFVPADLTHATYDWVFGDDSTSTAVSPVHTFINGDTNDYTWNYMIVLESTLTVTTTAGCTATHTERDTIWLPTAAFFPSVGNGCAPLAVTFHDSSMAHNDIVQWKWHLGDGSIITANNGNPQSVTYNQPGHYASYLVVTNASGCKDTSYFVITEVGTSLTPAFTVDETEICIGETVQFSNQTLLADSVDAWHVYGEGYHQFHCWDDPAPSWTFQNRTGLMDVTMTAEFNGCYSSTTINDMILVKGPLAEIFLTYNCEDPYTVVFENRSQDFTDITWDFGDGSTSTDANPTHTYATRGDFQVVLTANNSGTGCATSTDNITVKIRDIKAQIASDSLMCNNVANALDASLSQDVHTECHGGYTWQFNDPSMRPITTTNPQTSVQFPNTGEIGITLIVVDMHGCRDTATTVANLYGLAANFTASDPSICPGQSVSWTNTSTSDTTIVSYLWNLGLPFTFSTAENPSFTYPTFVGSSIPVTLLVTDALGCSNLVQINLNMYQPTSTIGSVPTSTNICAGSNIAFTASDYTAGGSNLTFSCNFQDSSPVVTGQSVSHTFANSGQFIVTASFVEQASGCTGSATRVVNVQAYPEAAFTSDADTSGIICRPQNVVFQNSTVSSSPVTSVWNLGNGTTGTTSPIGTVYSQSGTFIATLITTTSYGCADTASQVYTVVGPQGDFFTDISVICRGEEITFTIIDTAEVYTYTWDFGDGNTAVNQSPVSHTYTFVPPSGQTVAKLIVSSLNGACPIQQEQDIFIHEVVANFQRNDGVDTALCFQPYGFTNQSLNSNVFFWDFGDGTTSTTQNPNTHTYPAPGTYTVTLGVLNTTLGCNDTMMRDIVLHPIPVVTAQGDTICEGQTASLQVLDVFSPAVYLWSGPEPVADPNVPNTSAAPVMTTEFEIAVTDTNGCTSSDFASIVVINPLVLTDFDTSIVIGDIINLPFNADTNVYNIVWSPSEGLSCDDCPLPSLQPMVDVEYQLTVTDVRDCFTATATYKVVIRPETFIKLPTTFTPNGDGVNDHIFVEGWGIKELMEYQIYNRWGEMLFETNDKEVGWDGHYKGTLQNNDVYVFKVRALTWRDETQTLEGHINLMR